MLAFGSSGAGGGLTPAAASESTELAGSEGERIGAGAAGTMAWR
jgi:hypothetical protein